MIISRFIFIFAILAGLNAQATICDEAISAPYTNAIAELASGYLDLEIMQTDDLSSKGAQLALKKQLDQKKSSLVAELGQEQFDKAFARAIELKSDFKRNQRAKSKMRRDKPLANSLMLRNWVERNRIEIPQVSFTAEFNSTATKIAAVTERNLFIYDAATGAELFQVQAPDSYINRMNFPREFKNVHMSPNGKLVAATGTVSKVSVIDIETGKEAFELDHEVYFALSLRFSPDGRKIVTTSGGGKVYLWSAKTGKVLKTFDFLEPVYADFSPNSKMLAVASKKDFVKVIDISGTKEPVVLENLSSEFSFLKWSPDGSRILTGAKDNTARLWDISTAREINQFSDADHRILSGGFHPSGSLVATGSHSTISIWSVNGDKPLQILNGHKSYLESINFSSDGNLLLTAGWDGKIIIWQAAPPEDED